VVYEPANRGVLSDAGYSKQDQPSAADCRRRCRYGEAWITPTGGGTICREDWSVGTGDYETVNFLYTNVCSTILEQKCIWEMAPTVVDLSQLCERLIIFVLVTALILFFLRVHLHVKS
jgi:hypothetical protein